MGNFEGEKWPVQDMPGHVRRSITQSHSVGGSTGTVRMPIGCTRYRGALWRNLANTTEPSACGGDAALRQSTSTSCYESGVVVRAVTRQMRLRRRKLEEILRWKPTSARSLRLPRLTSSGPAAVNSLSFTISDGLRWKVRRFIIGRIAVVRA